MQNENARRTRGLFGSPFFTAWFSFLILSNNSCSSPDPRVGRLRPRPDVIFAGQGPLQPLGEAVGRGGEREADADVTVPAVGTRHLQRLVVRDGRIRQRR